MIESIDKDFRAGLFFSIIAHGVLVYYLLFNVGNSWSDFAEPVVYSISIEGGKTLGGISQVPKDDKKAPIAPPKVVGGEKENGQKEKKERIEEDKDAEVSLREKEEEKRKEEEKKKEKAKKAAGLQGAILTGNAANTGGGKTQLGQ